MSAAAARHLRRAHDHLDAAHRFSQRLLDELAPWSGEASAAARRRHARLHGDLAVHRGTLGDGAVVLETLHGSLSGHLQAGGQAGDLAVHHLHAGAAAELDSIRARARLSVAVHGAASHHRHRGHHHRRRRHHGGPAFIERHTQRHWGRRGGLYHDPSNHQQFAWVWTTAFFDRARLRRLARRGHVRRRDVRRILAGLERYHRGGMYYASESRSGGVFYDDNAWVGLTYMDAYRLTGDRRYLRRARAALRFVERGWNAHLGGGVTWQRGGVGSQDYRSSVSTAAAAQLALQVYIHGHDRAALHFAVQACTWMDSTMLHHGLYSDHILPNGHVVGSQWSYNQGLMIQNKVLLAQVAADPAVAAQLHLAAPQQYLDQANAVAQRALQGMNQPLRSQPPGFNAVFFDSLHSLNAVTPSPAYTAAIATYAGDVSHHVQPSTGIVQGLGGPPSLLSQAGGVWVGSLL